MLTYYVTCSFILVEELLVCLFCGFNVTAYTLFEACCMCLQSAVKKWVGKYGLLVLKLRCKETVHTYGQL